MKDEHLLEAFNTLEELRKTPDTLIAYHSRLKVIIDEEAKLDYAEHKGIKKGIELVIEQGIEKGIEQGIEQGIEKGIELIVQKMIAKGKSTEEIMDATDLTYNEVETIRHKK